MTCVRGASSLVSVSSLANTCSRVSLPVPVQAVLVPNSQAPVNQSDDRPSSAQAMQTIFLRDKRGKDGADDCGLNSDYRSSNRISAYSGFRRFGPVCFLRFFSRRCTPITASILYYHSWNRVMYTVLYSSTGSSRHCWTTLFGPYTNSPNNSDLSVSMK